MKLRIRDNSLRLRLTQAEVCQIRDLKPVISSVQFAPGKTLTYCLEPSPFDQAISAALGDHEIRISIPHSVALSWSTSEQVGILSEQPLTESSALTILIEKDFTCLKPRSLQPEDESDLFPNPNSALGHCG